MTAESKTEEVHEENALAKHTPVRDFAECPSCGDGPCPHRTAIQYCRECEEDWPCSVIRMVTGELRRLIEGDGELDRVRILDRIQVLESTGAESEDEERYYIAEIPGTGLLQVQLYGTFEHNCWDPRPVNLDNPDSRLMFRVDKATAAAFTSDEDDG